MRIFTCTITLLLITLSIFATTHPSKDIPPTIIDTLYLDLEDCITSGVWIAPFGNPNDTFYIFGNSPPTGGVSLVGDGWSFDYSCNTSNRLYFSFPMPEGHTGYTIAFAQLMVFQWNSSGNSEEHVFPIWGQGESHGLLAAHVNFIQPLTSVTYTPAFCQNMGVISSDAEIGWKNMDVTTYYKNAKEQQNWNSFQVMLYFDILTDWDNSWDEVTIGDPGYAPTCPRLLLTYQTVSTAEDENQIIQAPRLNIYPNPAKTHTTIKAESGYRITNASLFNLKGQKVRCDNILTYESPNELQLNTETLPAGVYIIKSKLSNGTDQKELCNKLLIY